MPATLRRRQPARKWWPNLRHGKLRASLNLAEQLLRKGQDTLEFKCECRNGTTPDMSQYEQSVPGQMCRFWFDQCINATNQNLEFQVSCQNERNAKCGNLTVEDGTSSSSAASAGPTASGTRGTGGGASATAAAPSSASSGAATAIAMAREYGTPVLAGGMLAIFGLAL